MLFYSYRSARDGQGFEERPKRQHLKNNDVDKQTFFTKVKHLYKFLQPLCILSTFKGALIRFSSC